MTPLHKIRHHLLEDTDGVARHLEDFVSVPAFIYQLREDNYLSISGVLLRELGFVLADTTFQTFLERMHPADRKNVFSVYAQDVPLLMRHREHEPPPRLRGFDFRIADASHRWRSGVVKLDVAGYDAQGRPDKLFGVFLLDDTPLEEVEKVYDTQASDLFGEALTARIQRVTREVRRLSSKQRDEPGPVITPQEKKLIHGLAQGYSTRELALHLNLSFHTVEDYRKNLLKKFDARNTVHMVLKAAKLLPGVLDGNTP